MTLLFADQQQQKRVYKGIAAGGIFDASHTLVATHTHPLTPLLEFFHPLQFVSRTYARTHFAILQSYYFIRKNGTFFLSFYL